MTNKGLNLISKTRMCFMKNFVGRLDAWGRTDVEVTEYRKIICVR